jgi:hypothetical protein
MKITTDQRNELWKLRTSILLFRTPLWIFNSFLGPLILILMPGAQTGFRRDVMTYLLAGYFPFLVYSLIAYNLLNYLKKKRSKVRFVHQITILLYFMYDIFSIMIIGSILWFSGCLSINSRGLILQLLLCHLFLFVFAALISPWLIIQKINQSNQPTNNNRSLSIAFALSSLIPGFGVFVYAILTNVFHISFSGDLLAVLMIGIGSFLTFLSTIGICEFLIIGMNKWPHISKTNSKYSVDPIP